MDSQPTTTGAAGPVLTGDPREQIISLLTPVGDGTGFIQVAVPLKEINEVYATALNTSICYASQIGACFIMLLVVLTMTAKARFARVPTLINIAALVVSIIRCTLLVIFFTSTMMDFYSVFAADYSFFDPNDVRRSIVASFFTIPQMALAEAALMVQAWAMVELWPTVWKAGAIAGSLVLALVTFGFKCATTAIAISGAITRTSVLSYLWVRHIDLALTTAMVTWFCFLFNVRLVMHMWSHRSILPTVKGLSPMEVLVMANGLLMVFPVLFAALFYAQFGQFESGVLTITSVVLVLPLGTLVAQRLATVQPNGGSGSADTELSDKRGFLASSGGGHHPLSGGSSSSSSSRTPKLSTKVSAAAATRGRADPIDLELQRIDDNDGEDSEKEGPRLGGVMVETTFERREERL